MNTLEQEYRRIAQRHWDAERHFFARVVLASSVMRVFRPGTRPRLFSALLRVELEPLKSLSSHHQFKEYFETELDRLSRVIAKTNKGNTRIYPGYKWGHGTKILCLFLRDVVLHSHYFSTGVAHRVSRLLYTPIDKVVIRRLKALGCVTEFKSIKDIDSPGKYFSVQSALQKAAAAVGIPRIWFDDNWGQRI